MKYLLYLLLLANLAHAQPTRPTAQAAPPVPAEPVSRAELVQEMADKLRRVQQFLAERNLGGVLLSRTNNFSWLTAGLADNHIVITSETGPAGLLVLRDGRKFVVANSTEVAHLQAEDLQGLGFESLQYPWSETAPDPRLALLKQVAGGQPLATDAPLADLPVVDAQLAPLRYPLSDSEIKKYRWVCRQTAEAVAAVCRRLQPGLTERQIEALASDELLRRGLRPTVLLMGVDERLRQFYHYPPTDKKLVHHAFVNVCARRWGLVASVGRYVYFGAVPAELRKNMQASANICARFEAATVPGAKARDLFEQGKRWYADNGFPDEWQQIHQGGGIGYAEREWVANAHSTEVVQPRQAFAWNPFTPAALSFDTVLLGPDGKLENLTYLADWPTLKVQVAGKTYLMPDMLVR